MSKKYMQRGFTLLELLIALAIIGTLLGSLLWNFGGALRQGQLTQAQSHGAQVSAGLAAFLTRNIDLNLEDWTATLPPGNLNGAPASLSGLTGYDCRQAVTLSRNGYLPGSGSWRAAPAKVGCLIEQVGQRLLVYTWVEGLDKHYINGEAP